MAPISPIMLWLKFILVTWSLMCSACVSRRTYSSLRTVSVLEKSSYVMVLALCSSNGNTRRTLGGDWLMSTRPPISITNYYAICGLTSRLMTRNRGLACKAAIIGVVDWLVRSLLAKLTYYTPQTPFINTWNSVVTPLHVIWLLANYKTRSEVFLMSALASNSIASSPIPLLLRLRYSITVDSRR